MAPFVVIGGGVVGLCCAYSLVERGATVTVVEAREGAHGASVVNAGWVTPTLADPVPAPGLVRTSLKWMLRSDSPLYIRPASMPGMSRWLFDFWRHCNQRDFIAGGEACSELGRSTMPLFDGMKAAGVEFEMHADGLLHAYLSTTAMEHDYAVLASIIDDSITMPQMMDGNAVRSFEPALNDSVQGGFWFDSDRSVQPASFANGLRDWLAGHGVEFRTGTRVTGFHRGGSGIDAVETSQGTISCEGAVIAAGAQSGQVSKLAGRPLPIQGGKGYCLNYSPPPVVARHPTYLHEARVAVTPFDGALRLAGTMEFSGINEVVRPERLSAISRASSKMLRNVSPDPAQASSTGSGLRPMAPDGIPVIGLLNGYSNLSVATGHAMLGLTLGPSTGDVIGELMTTGKAPDVIAPFSPSRFRA
ncbi:MAG: FAD-dependent oxidoreductase [Thermomicrobiales bacterium]